MSSASITDYLAEKLFSFSSKMRGDSYQPNFASYLLDGYDHQQYGLSNVLNEITKSNVIQVEVSDLNKSYQPSLRPFGVLGGLKYVSSMNKPGHFMNINENWKFSQHLCNLVSDSNIFKHYKNSPVLPSIKRLFNTGSDCTFSVKSKQSEMKKTCDPPVTESEMQEKATSSPVCKQTAAKEKCDFTHSLRLNLELAQRKTKELNKRSKKRRRRLRKSEQPNISNSTSSSDDDDVDCDHKPPVMDNISIIAGSPDFKCTLSVRHTVQMSPCKSSFLIPVESDSDDDSDWETFDEIELSKASSMKCGTKRGTGHLAFECSRVKSPNPQSMCSLPAECGIQMSTVLSFVVPEDDSCDNDSDWDSCETSTFCDDTDFESFGLFLANLCTPQILSSNCDFNSVASAEEGRDILQLKADLRNINKRWNEYSVKDDDKPKSESKVTFAPEKDLLEVFPVEMFERKGEWEQFATERIRFKRKINELEKVLAPCLTEEHRLRIFKELVEPNL